MNMGVSATIIRFNMRQLEITGNKSAFRCFLKKAEIDAVLQVVSLFPFPSSPSASPLAVVVPSFGAPSPGSAAPLPGSAAGGPPRLP